MRILHVLLALAGTTSCGSPGLTTRPTAPVSGKIDSDVGGTTPLSQLGLGCLYFEGGLTDGRSAAYAPVFRQSGALI